MIDKKFANEMAKDLKKVLIKYSKKKNELFSEEPFVILDGEKVTDEEEIRLAFGGDCISRKTYERLTRELEEKKAVKEGSQEDYSRILNALSSFIMDVLDESLTQQEKDAKVMADIASTRRILGRADLKDEFEKSHGKGRSAK